MPLTRTAARDAIFLQIKTLLEALTAPSVSIVWTDRREDIPDQNSDPLPAWARVTLSHGPGAQRTLGDRAASRRFTYTFILTIQLFTPTGEGQSAADAHTDSILAGLRASSIDGILMRNVSGQEVGVDGPWFQTNILAEGEYDQVG